jgi:hypothetical protein
LQCSQSALHVEETESPSGQKQTENSVNSDNSVICGREINKKLDPEIVSKGVKQQELQQEHMEMVKTCFLNRILQLSEKKTGEKRES